MPGLGGLMTSISLSSYFDAIRELTPQIEECVEESERTRRLPSSLVDALAQVGMFRLLIPRALGGEEVDAMTFVEVIEAISRVDGATGWCVMIGGCYGVFGGYLPAQAAREILWQRRASDQRWDFSAIRPSGRSRRRISRLRPMASRERLPSLHLDGRKQRNL